MGGWFSSYRKKRKTQKSIAVQLNDESILSEQDRAILELKRQKDKLNKYTIKLNRTINRETEVARQLLQKGFKSTALLCIKRRKYQTSLLEKTRSEISNLETLVNSIEFTSQSIQIFKALERGTRVLEQLNQETSIEKIDQLLSDSNAAIEYQQQIDELLSQNNEIAQSIDEESLNEEIEIMQKRIEFESAKDTTTTATEKEQIQAPNINQNEESVEEAAHKSTSPQRAQEVSPKAESAAETETRNAEKAVDKPAFVTSWKKEVVLS